MLLRLHTAAGQQQLCCGWSGMGAPANSLRQRWMIEEAEALIGKRSRLGRIIMMMIFVGGYCSLAHLWWLDHNQGKVERLICNHVLTLWPNEKYVHLHTFLAFKIGFYRLVYLYFYWLYCNHLIEYSLTLKPNPRLRGPLRQIMWHLRPPSHWTINGHIMMTMSGTTYWQKSAPSFGTVDKYTHISYCRWTQLC